MKSNLQLLHCLYAVYRWVVSLARSELKELTKVCRVIVSGKRPWIYNSIDVIDET